MTSETAICNLKIIRVFVEPVTKEQLKLINDTFDMAIEALKSEPCEDSVSREAAIMAMQELEQRDIEAYGCKIPEGFDATEAIKALKALPSVTPARKKEEPST